MPVVPVSQPRVQGQILRAPQAQRADFSGVQNLAKGIGQASDVMGKQLLKDQMKEAEARVAEAENALHSDLLQADTNYQQLQGKEAFDGKQAYLDNVQGIIESHRSKLTTKFQHEIYSQVADKRSKVALTTGEVHSREQLKKYNIEQKGAKVTLAKQDSMQNPFMSITNQAEIDLVVDDLLQGSSPEVIEAEKLKQSSLHFMGVADYYLGLEKPDQAKEYLDRMKQHYGDRQIVTAEDQNKFDIAYEEMRGKVEVGKAINEIYDPHSDDLAGMMEAGWDRFVNTENPDMESFLKFNQLLGLKMQAQEKTEDKARDTMRNNIFDSIQRGEWTTANYTKEQLELLDSSDQMLIRNYEEMWTIKAKETSGISAVMDWYSLPLEEMKDGQRLMTEFLPEMNERQQNIVTGEWRRLQIGGAKTADSGFQESMASQLNTMYRDLGIDGTTNARKDKQNALKKVYGDAMNRYIAENGKNPSREEMQAIQKDVTKEYVLYDGYKPVNQSIPLIDKTATAYNYPIPVDDDGVSLMSDDDRALAIAVIKDREKREKRFIPLTDAQIWETHLKIREELQGNDMLEEQNTQGSILDSDPNAVDADSFAELKLMAEAEIPSEDSIRARELVDEIERRRAVADTNNPVEAYELMNQDERAQYLKSLTIDQRGKFIAKLKKYDTYIVKKDWHGSDYGKLAEEAENV